MTRTGLAGDAKPRGSASSDAVPPNPAGGRITEAITLIRTHILTLPLTTDDGWQPHDGPNDATRKHGADPQRSDGPGAPSQPRSDATGHAGSPRLVGPWGPLDVG